ncbi:MAG: hypothetical protein PHV82_11605 [Victivallaceae bacterium]|nr:hypothetical protein [Victivallaceae bacterium]
MAKKPKIYIVTVVKDFDLYEESIKTNPYMKDCVLVTYDNSQEDVSITQRYNDFLENHLDDISPKDWIVFCNQGFSFMEDFTEMVLNLEPNAIYGVMGAATRKKFSWRRFRFVNHIVKVGGVIKDKENLPEKSSRKDRKVKPVDTVDSCCMMVNAELLQDFHLNFNEKLPFFFFIEEFCFAALYKYKIKSYVLPLDAYYLGPQEFPPEYYESKEYLRAEYHLNDFASYNTVELHPTRYSLENMVETVVETVVGIVKD